VSDKGQKKQKVVFVGGYGRSGSTIIDLLLNRVPGVIAVGEFRHLFGRALTDNELCSCGHKFRDCPFWKKIIKEAFPDGYDAERIQRAVRHFNRLAMLPKIRREDRLSADEQADAKLYREAFAAAYRAVAKVSGAEVIVDSTKYPMHGWFLSTMPEIDLSVMLLVRDPRAVAYSWQRKRLRPEIWWEEREMPRYSLARSALAWDVSNRLTAELEPFAADYRVQRYEDFIADPAGELADIASFVLGRTVELPADLFDRQPHLPHTIAGNPVRIGSEHVKVKEDNEWKHMPAAGRLLISGLSAPQMVQYDYPLIKT